jgi:hypothetical protein
MSTIVLRRNEALLKLDQSNVEPRQSLEEMKYVFSQNLNCPSCCC